MTIKVMVIDDSTTVLKAASKTLREAGYEVFTATDGFAAMSEIADHHPDLIFIDIVMPRLDGYQACSLVKGNRRFRDTPVVMLSSKDGLFDRARGRIVGAIAHINKPFSRDELLQAVTRYAGRPGSAPVDNGPNEAEDGLDLPSSGGFTVEYADTV